MAVSTDACVKNCRFANCGTAQAGIQPSTDTFLGKNSQRVLEAHKAGTLGSRRSAPAEQPADAAPSAACTTALHCSRTSATNRGLLDICGVALIVCAHAFAGLGLAVAMPTPEQHAFYDILLSAALLARPDIRFIYLDLACRYILSFTRLLETMVKLGNIPTAIAGAGGMCGRHGAACCWPACRR